MLKALFKLILFVFIPLMFLVLSQYFNPLIFINERIQEKYMASIYLMTIDQIASEINSAPIGQQEQTLSAIKNHFGVDLNLVTLGEASDSQRKRNRLKKGELVFLEDEGSIFGYKLKDYDLVLSIAVDETDEQENYRVARGPIYFLKKLLSPMSESEILQSLEEWSKEYKVYFSLLSTNEAELVKEKEEDHFYKGLEWSVNEDGRETFYIRLPNDRVLLARPAEYKKLEYISIITNVSVIMFFVACGLFIWLWPLWKDHKRLNESAIAFGSGYLDSRVAIRKSSLAANLGHSFNLMADNIQRLISANQYLTNAVAHDLRTPLARLRFAMEMLASGECTEEERTRYQQTINTSIDSLDYLINQTLVHSRYNRSIDIKHFKYSNFSEQLMAEVEQYRFDFDHLEFVVNVDHLLAVKEQFVDPKALGRALSNLLSNAVKHAKSIVRVSYYRDEEHLCLQVEDDGQGISAEYYEKILEPFSRLGNEERSSSEGHGLGLAIVNQVAKWHKGEVVVSRSELGGASFKLMWVEMDKPEQAE